MSATAGEAALLRAADEHKQRGNAAYRDGRFQEAVAAYSDGLRALEQATGVLPDSGGLPAPLADVAGTLYSNRAMAQMKLDDYDSAQNDITLALYYKPRDDKAWMRLAAVQAKKRHIFAAVAAMERAVEVEHAMQQDNYGQSEASRRLRNLQRKAAEQGTLPPIVALCGSHIANSARLARLRQMVGSWYIQWHAVPLRISLSCTSGMQDEVQGAVSDLLQLYCGLSILLNCEELSQGQHYQLLVRRLQQQGCDGKATWLLLTDDDDLWHPQRSMLYAAKLQELSSSHPGPAPEDQVLSICSLNYFNADKAHAAWSPFDVSRLHASGAALTVKPFPGEAWGFSTRLCTLAQFFAACNPCVVSHLYWDVCFVKFLRNKNSNVVYVSEDYLNWMYFYRRDEAVGPASRLLASTMLSDSILASLTAFVGSNLQYFCAQSVDFDVDAFATLIDECTVDPKLKPCSAALCRKMADELLSDTEGIHYKLLKSPLPSVDHA